MPNLRVALGLRDDVTISENPKPLTYGASITPSVSGGGVLFSIVITDASAFTINAPTGSFVAGSVITFDIKNSSGGAHGTITWNAVYAMPALAAIASTKRKTLQFYNDGTNWVQVGAASPDI